MQTPQSTTSTFLLVPGSSPTEKQKNWVGSHRPPNQRRVAAFFRATRSNIWPSRKRRSKMKRAALSVIVVTLFLFGSSALAAPCQQGVLAERLACLSKLVGDLQAQVKTFKQAP